MTPAYILRKSLCREAHCGELAQEHDLENIRYAGEYAEPGYQDPAKGILFANWNRFPTKVTDLLEKYGYDCVWEDEWSTCSNCSKAFRTSPDSYSWQAAYIEQDGELFCLECVDWKEYLQHIEDDPRIAIQGFCNPAEYGYELIEDKYENGWYEGQNDDPKKILAELHAKGIRNVVFRISRTRQFDIDFEAWRRVENTETE